MENEETKANDATKEVIILPTKIPMFFEVSSVKESVTWTDEVLARKDAKLKEVSEGILLVRMFNKIFFSSNKLFGKQSNSRQCNF